ncbi:hypothetical protein L6452_15488 [Arctium lappa]|uniref:Uncharacterized protein n=1 Tax=Arctium lappa TaxID=4217 RepID=A0ACB9CNX0_ARCLA|nr:hypothetical protein L6452_15488 [Arctium lappa]
MVSKLTSSKWESIVPYVRFISILLQQLLCTLYPTTNDYSLPKLGSCLLDHEPTKVSATCNLHVGDLHPLSLSAPRILPLSGAADVNDATTGKITNEEYVLTHSETTIIVLTAA